MYFTIVFYFYTCISSFTDTFSCYIVKDYDVEFLNKNGSSLEHIKERIAEFLVMQVIDPKGEFHFGLTLRLRTLC
jgi:hypothetical protein